MLDPMIDWHINVLARTIYGISQGQSAEVREAFAAVIMNRCAAAMVHNTNKVWGLTIADVCLKPGQFTCWDDDSPYRSAAILAAPGDREFMDCFLLATRAAHGFYEDHTDGADTFVGSGELTTPEKPGELTATIGGYDFYRTLPELPNAS